MKKIFAFLLVCLSCGYSRGVVGDGNLIAWYRFDKADQLGLDSSENEHDGTNWGAEYSAQGIVNGCAYFAGDGQYIRVPHHTDFLLTNLTVTFWLKTPTDGCQGGQNRIVAKWRREAQTEGWYGHITGDDGISVICGDGTLDVERPLHVLRCGRMQWVHVTYQISSDSCAIYTNGVMAVSTNWAVPATLLTDADLCIGGFNSWGWAWLQGWLDEVKIWGRALAPEEIAAEAIRNLPPFVTVTPTQQVVSVGQVAALAVAYGDPDGTAEMTINGLPDTAIVNSNWTSVIWTPGAGDVGEHTLEFVVTDNELLSLTASAVIIVTQRTDRLEIVTRMLPNGTVNAPYNAVLQAAGGVRPYAWSVTDGALPEGISMDANGVIAGQTAAAGCYEFMARVTDGNNQFVERLFRFAIDGGTATAVRILTSALPDAVLGEAYAVVLRADGGVPPYAWAVEDGELPGGLTLDPASGAISGTALAAANASFIVKVEDQNGGTDRKPLVIRVRPADDYNLEISAVTHAQFMINWHKHIKGDDDVDNIWMRLMFAVPDGLLLEPALPVTLFFGAYPIDGANALVTPNGRRATYYQGDVSVGDLPVVKMIVQFKKIDGADVGVVYAIVKYADLDGALGALNETVVNGRLTVPVHLLLGAYEGCTSIEMRYDAKKDKKGKGAYPAEK